MVSCNEVISMARHDTQLLENQVCTGQPSSWQCAHARERDFPIRRLQGSLAVAPHYGGKSCTAPHPLS
jgi:hypothetical protein